MDTLTIDQKIETKYCIEDWLRDEQIAHALSLPGVGRIAPAPAKRAEPIAIVGYGPSLNDTWEKVRGYEYAMTCSGAHRFLLDRGIVPTWHVEVDPRAHKVALLGTPHPSVEYLVAAPCHPDYFAHLLAADATVKLWHVYDDDAEAKRRLPAGEWALTGGASVGLRCLTLAHFLGFTDLHVFGMDGSEGASGTHAAAHPNQPNDLVLVEYPVGSGTMWKTTASMMTCARQTWHELDQLPGVRATFYGEGLVQAMARDYVPNPVSAGRVTIGAAKPVLISSDYLEQQTQLHRNPAYGVGGPRHVQTVLQLAAAINTKNILDYGCGKGRLGRAIPWQIAEYDPAVPGKEMSPKPADLVVCLDVLEHIEPDRLTFVLDDLRRVTRQVGYFVIHTGASAKALPDGRNAHLIQQGREWWESALGKFFKVGTITETPPLLHVVVGPKGAR